VRALQLRAEIGLARVHRDEIRPQGEYALHVGIDEGAHPLQLHHLGRIPIEAADGDNL
jgi:hypothetical protein